MTYPVLRFCRAIGLSPVVCMCAAAQKRGSAPSHSMSSYCFAINVVVSQLSVADPGFLEGVSSVLPGNCPIPGRRSL